MSLATELATIRNEVKEYALEYGLDFFETIFEVLDFDQLNEVASYGGFPRRYPHWRYGMQYEEMMKGYAWGLSKIYELVINNDPCYAYLMRSNSLLDQKMVMAHVYGHCDFFKNNLWFAHTNRKMMDQMANHGTRVRRMVDRFGIDAVERFLDACLSLENLIDVHSVSIRRSRPVTEAEIEEDELTTKSRVKKIKSKGYMDRYINPPEYIEAQRKKLQEAVELKKRFPPEPVRDVLLFLLEHAELRNWELDILSMVREEAYYFAPQAMTKVMNEGWACVTGATRVFTDRGVLPMREIVEGRLPVRVFDGESFQNVTDYARFEKRETVRIRTKRGYEVEGSRTHRLLRPDGTWAPLSDLRSGDRVTLTKGSGPVPEVRLTFESARRLRLDDVADLAGVNVSTVIRHRSGEFTSRSAESLDPLVERYEAERRKYGLRSRSRKSIRVPPRLDVRLARWLGLLLSDGNISDVKRVVSFTTGDRELAEEFANLASGLFDLIPKTQVDGSRIRVHLCNLELIEFLGTLGLPSGPAARKKTVPDAVLRSPHHVIAAFLSGLFDGDGYAGRQGVILSTASVEMGRVVQELLLGLGMLSSRRRQRDGVWHVHISGCHAKTFEEAVGFGLGRKHEALNRYITDHKWFKRSEFEDEIVEITTGRADVFDVTVAETHRYAAAGFVNHNSYWHSKIMTQKALKDSEIIDFAERHAGTMATAPGQINPYKLGIELFRDIEERWDKGRFGKAWEEEDNADRKQSWDTGAGLGREKIFEVRKIYNDVTFIDTFLTREFCEDQKLFAYQTDPQTGERVISSRGWLDVKDQLVNMLTNRGQPVIEVLDGNYRNRKELYLLHRWEGVDLKIDFATETLVNLHRLWGRPVHIETKIEGKGRVFSFDGEDHTIEDLTPTEE